jgi:hypothetical protein
MVDRERRDGETAASYTERMLLNMRAQLDAMRAQIEAERGDMYSLKSDLRELKVIFTERERATVEWRGEVKRELAELQVRVDKLKDGQTSGGGLILGFINPMHVFAGLGLGGALMLYKLLSGE